MERTPRRPLRWEKEGPVWLIMKYEVEMLAKIYINDARNVPDHKTILGLKTFACSMLPTMRFLCYFTLPLGPTMVPKNRIMTRPLLRDIVFPIYMHLHWSNACSL